VFTRVCSRSQGFGHVALIDVRWDRWRTDAAGRYLVTPRVVSHLANCSTDVTRGLSVGKLCGARAVAVVDETVRLFCYFRMGN